MNECWVSGLPSLLIEPFIQDFCFSVIISVTGGNKCSEDLNLDHRNDQFQ